MGKDFEILTVKMNNEIFSVGDYVIHNDGNYTTKILKFVLSDTIPNMIWFYDNEEMKYVKDLNNFRSIINRKKKT